MNIKSALVAGAIIFYAGASFAQSCVPAPDGLVSWWPGDGDALDIVDGNTPYQTDGIAKFVPAVVGQGMKFNGQPDGYVVADNENLRFGTGSFSVDAWVRFDGPGPGVGDRNPVVDFRGENYAGFALVYRSPCQCYEFLFTGWYDPTLTDVHVESSPVTDGEFHHVAGVADRDSDPGTISIFIDGVLQADVKSINPLADTSNTLPRYIGHRSVVIGTSLDWFNGVVDELEVFNRALTAAEILAIYNAGSAGKCKPVQLTCTGFMPPFDEALSLKKKVKRAIPVKMMLTDEAGSIVTDTDIVAPPVINVFYDGQVYGEVPPDTDDLLPLGSANEDNVFRFDPDSWEWIYNLGSKQFSAPGTYTVQVTSGDFSEYEINAAEGYCTQTFERLP